MVNIPLARRFLELLAFINSKTFSYSSNNNFASVWQYCLYSSNVDSSPMLVASLSRESKTASKHGDRVFLTNAGHQSLPANWPKILNHVLICCFAEEPKNASPATHDSLHLYKKKHHECAQLLVRHISHFYKIILDFIAKEILKLLRPRCLHQNNTRSASQFRTYQMKFIFTNSASLLTLWCTFKQDITDTTMSTTIATTIVRRLASSTKSFSVSMMFWCSIRYYIRSSIINLQQASSRTKNPPTLEAHPLLPRCSHQRRKNSKPLDSRSPKSAALNQTL